MTTSNRLCSIVVRMFACFLLVSVTVAAQEEVGGLYGTVTDTEKQVLPGVTVSLSGMGADRDQITDAQGRFRFLGLDPGGYGMAVTLDGFSRIEYPRIDVRAGRNTTVAVEMSPAIGEVITVTSETPLLDERKLAQGSILTQVDLDAIPTARDPWAVLNQAPGVLLDRVNVGGNESAQQAAFIAPGALVEDNHYLIDGVEITDSSVGGATPTYYDFDQFSQFELGTGGGEITKQTAGVSINMVTKRGTNEMKGSARFFVTDADGYLGVLQEGEPTIDPDELGVGQTEAITGNRIDRIEEYGFEAGGPAWRDHLWLWGSWGNTHTRTFAADGQPQEFTLENVAVKLNAQLVAANSLVASWTTGNKTADARGAGPSRAPETTSVQRGPTDIMKLEDTHVFGSSLFVSGTGARVLGGFELRANGGTGPDAPEPLLDSDGVWKRNLWSFWSQRPSEEWKADASYFLGTGAASHELKFGARYREMDFRSAYVFPGTQLVHVAGENFGWPSGPGDFFSAWRSDAAPGSTEYLSVWLQDTVNLGKWTLNAGLRWDRQEGANEPATVPANPVFPELLPALDFAGNDAGGFDWTTISPRLGATYALGQERQTLLRASYARFAQQLSGTAIWRVNPLSYAYAYFYFIDSNDNNTWDGWEVDGRPYLFFWANFDPTDPDALESPNLNDPGLDPPLTDELVLSVEHSLLPEFVIGLDLLYRQTVDVLEERQLVRLVDGTVRQTTRGDFVLDQTLTGELPDGSPYAVDFYALRPGLIDTGGTLATNGDRKREYRGLNLHLTKRLSNQWMLRGYLTYGRSQWSIPESFYQYKDPTDLAGATWTWSQTTQDNDGDIYFDLGGRWGSLMQSTWAFNLNGMYQFAPDRAWGFNVAGNVYGRQGYPLAYFVRYPGSDGISRSADAVRAADQFRMDDLLTVDLRLEKEFAATGNVGFTFAIDAFNFLNESTVLRRMPLYNGARPDYLEETLSPRIYRLSVRINWR